MQNTEHPASSLYWFPFLGQGTTSESAVSRTSVGGWQTFWPEGPRPPCDTLGPSCAPLKWMWLFLSTPLQHHQTWLFKP